VYWLWNLKGERKTRREVAKWLLEDGQRRRGYGGCGSGGILRNGESGGKNGGNKQGEMAVSRGRKRVRFQEQGDVTGVQEEEEEQGRDWWLTEAWGEQRVLRGLFRAVDGEINAAGEMVVKVEERFVYGLPFDMQLY